MKDLRFLINGSEIDMGNNTMVFTYKNPMFEEIGSHSLPLQIPRKRHNDGILKTFHSGSASLSSRYSAQLYIGALPFQGEFVLSSINDRYYEGHFTTGNSTFRDMVKEVKLSDLDYTEVIYGTETVSFTDALTAAAKSSYPTHNYTCFPMLDPQYYEQDPFAYNAMINPWSYHPTNPDLEAFYASSSRNLTLLYAPSFYLCFVIKKVFDAFGYAIETNEFYDDSELRTLVVVNFNTLGEVDTTYRQYDLKFSDALPPISINDFLSGIEKLFNVTFFVSDASKLVNIKKNTSVIKSIPVGNLRLTSREVQPEENKGFKLSYTMDSNDPFSSISEIGEYELGITVDNEEDLDDYNANDYPNKLAKISNNDLYYISKLTDAETDTWSWEKLTKDFFDYIEGDGDLEINSIANPVLTDNDFLYCWFGTGLKEFAIFPKVEISCINSNGIQEFKTFETLRLLFYRGVVPSGGAYLNPDNIEGNYPLATPDVWRPKGLTNPARFGRIKITNANQALRWDGDYGLYKTHWKDYLYWYQNLKRAAKDHYDMSLQEFLAINFWEKYQAGNISLLFRSIELEIDFVTDSCRFGECEVYLG